jgi:hypothetical protein
MVFQKPLFNVLGRCLRDAAGKRRPQTRHKQNTSPKRSTRRDLGDATGDAFKYPSVDAGYPTDQVSWSPTKYSQHPDASTFLFCRTETFDTLKPRNEAKLELRGRLPMIESPHLSMKLVLEPPIPWWRTRDDERSRRRKVVKTYFDTSWIPVRCYGLICVEYFGSAEFHYY